jgi:hypothetical protein
MVGYSYREVLSSERLEGRSCCARHRKRMHGAKEEGNASATVTVMGAGDRSTAEP